MLNRWVLIWANDDIVYWWIHTSASLGWVTHVWISKLSHHFLAATKQLLEYFFLSVCLLSVRPWRPSVCHTFFIMFTSSYHDIFRSYYLWQTDVHVKGQGLKSKVKVTYVMTPFNRFRTVTPVWIHICGWNDAQGLMLLRRGSLLFFKVICQISRSHG